MQAFKSKLLYRDQYDVFFMRAEFSPYHIGHFTLAGLQLQEMTKVQHFEGLLVTLCGYCVVGICLVLLHGVASVMKLKR